MEDLKTAAGPDNAAHPPHETVRVEIILPGAAEPKALELPAGGDLPDAVRQALGLGPDTLLFEVDADEPLTEAPPGRKALRLVAHPARLITVEVNYDHRTERKDFPPSKTVFKVLQWAVGKQGFDLDPASAARANLILPGAETPLPRETAIGAYVAPGAHVLVVDLTLKDFTNG